MLVLCQKHDDCNLLSSFGRSRLCRLHCHQLIISNKKKPTRKMLKRREVKKQKHINGKKGQKSANRAKQQQLKSIQNVERVHTKHKK